MTARDDEPEPELTDLERWFIEAYAEVLKTGRLTIQTPYLRVEVDWT